MRNGRFEAIKLRDVTSAWIKTARNNGGTQLSGFRSNGQSPTRKAFNRASNTNFSNSLFKIKREVDFLRVLFWFLKILIEFTC